MSLGRPAMRAKERRTVADRLIRHDTIMRIMIYDGMQADEASRTAYDIVITTKRRKAIWRTK
jgi:hypothetical protein